MSLTRLSSRLLPCTHRVFVSQIRGYASRPIPAAKEKYVPTSGTYPLGFQAGTAHAGVKASNTEFDDLALIASDQPCVAAAVFTTNRFRAAPCNVSRRTIRDRGGNGIRSIIVNSGCANAVTGSGGIEDAETMADETDQCFYKDSNGEADKYTRTLVMSTGVIGQRLPMDKIKSKIPTAYYALGGSHEHWLAAANAICTTDTFPKLMSKTFTLPSSQEEYHFVGMTKGAGMIHPNMATLLGIICTDAPIKFQPLKAALQDASKASFNAITVDGDTSTNDTLAVMANGAAGGELIENVDAKDYPAFRDALRDFSIDLAKLVVRDGEGATKFVTIRVEQAFSSKVAQRIGRRIATSPLVKTALYGKDANWGRILCAIGNTPDSTDSVLPKKIGVSFVPSDGSEELKLLVNGEPETVDEKRAKEILELEDIEIKVTLGAGGKHSATVWTCDFSHEYITINGDYRT